MTNEFRRLIFFAFLILASSHAPSRLGAREPLDVVPGRAWQFPRDHGSHPEYRSEWWYFTGHFRSSRGGKTFGFQWTVFRIGLFPPSVPPQSSAWRAQELYFTHLALSDLSGGKFYASDGSARAALGLAEAGTEGFQVRTPRAEGSFQGDKLRLQGRADDFSFSLEGTGPREVVLHGDNGYSPKSREPGRASYYVSLPRLPVKGELKLGSDAYSVEGEAWMDHEFGSNQLAQGQTGWDWFGLRFGEGSSLMVYRLRGKTKADEFLSGTYVDETGRVFPLKGEDIFLEPGTAWKSPASGAVYPVAWRIRIPTHDVSLAVRADFPEQELDTGRSTQVIYWEGSVALEGRAGGREVTGQGYLEMTGYAGEGRPNF